MSLQIELNPVYMEEVQTRYGDIECAIRETLPWVFNCVALTQNLDDLRDSLHELDDEVGVFRAVIGCEVLSLAGSRPDVREWLCDYLGELELSEGARYQLAGIYSRLGVEARRAQRNAEAATFARKGLKAISCLTPRAITANLHYNLGVALEGSFDFPAAVKAFERSAAIDTAIGRPAEAAISRQRVMILRSYL